MPKVSILLPTRNGSRFIHQALESVIRQTMQDWELIVIDNGSTDETPNIVSGYAKKDSRILFLRYTEKEGIQHALNYGLHKARGVYIARIDDDDKWNSPDKLTQQLHYMAAHPDVLLLGTSLRVINEAGEVVGLVQHPVSDKDIRGSFMFKNPFAHASVLFSREAALALGGYSEKYRYVQDYDLWMKLAKKGKVANLPQAMLDWREARGARAEYDYIKSRYQLRILLAHSFEYPHFLLGFLKICIRTAVLFMLRRTDQARAWLRIFSARLRTFDLISLLFIISVATLIWRHGNVAMDLPKPFEVGITATFVLVFFTLLSSGYDRVFAMSFWRALRKPVIFLLIFAGATMLGSMSSLLTIPASGLSKGEIVLEYARLAFVGLLFVLTAYVAMRKRGVVKATLTTLAVAPLILWLGLFPALQNFFLADGRLRGAENDPNYLATLLTVSLFIAIIAYVRISSRLRYVALTLVVGLTPLVLLSGSRAAWLSAAVTFLVYALYEAIRSKGRKITRVFSVSIIILASFVAGFLIFPRQSQITIAYRAFSGVLSPRAFSQVLTWLDANAASRPDSVGGIIVLDSELAQSPKPIGFGQHRGFLWQTATKRFIHAPLGYGPAFYIFAPMEIVNGLPQGPHNLYLEAGLTAGYIGFIAWISFLIYIIRTALRGMRNSYIGTILAFTFFYLLINSFFLSTLTVRWMWIIMACIIAYEARVTKTEQI